MLASVKKAAGDNDEAQLIRRSDAKAGAIRCNQMQSAAISRRPLTHRSDAKADAIRRNRSQSDAIDRHSHRKAGRAGGLVRAPRPLERACISIFGRGALSGRAARAATPRALPPDERCNQRNQWVLISAHQCQSAQQLLEPIHLMSDAISAHPARNHSS